MIWKLMNSSFLPESDRRLAHRPVPSSFCFSSYLDFSFSVFIYVEGVFFSFSVFLFFRETFGKNFNENLV